MAANGMPMKLASVIEEQPHRRSRTPTTPQPHCAHRHHSRSVFDAACIALACKPLRPAEQRECAERGALTHVPSLCAPVRVVRPALSRAHRLAAETCHSMPHRPEGAHETYPCDCIRAIALLPACCYACPARLVPVPAVTHRGHASEGAEASRQACGKG